MGNTTLTEVQRRLRGFPLLEADWDSYGADPVAPRTVAAAEAILGCSEVAVPPWHTAPSSDGGVQLEWRQPGVELEIEFRPDGGVDYLLVQGEGDGRVFQERSGVTSTEVLRVLRQVLD